MSTLSELEVIAESGDPQEVLAFILAYIKRVENEKQIPGPTGAAGTPGPPGQLGKTPKIVADHPLYAHTYKDMDGYDGVRVGLYGPRTAAIRSSGQLSDSPTPAELIKKVQELIGLHESLIKALSDRGLIY